MQDFYYKTKMLTLNQQVVWKLGEPAVDLAIAMSIVSSYKEKETQMGDCFIGEIGLTGEIRKVNRVYDRVREAEKLGFKRVLFQKII